MSRIEGGSCAGAPDGRVCGVSTLLLIAIGLIVLWAVLRLALAVTGVLLHLLWIAAIVLAALWLIGRLRGMG